MSFTSAIYEGGLRHRRFQPFEHEFFYRLFMMYLDLEEMDDLFRDRWLWSNNGFAPAWFRRSDHIGNPQKPLHETLRDRVEEKSGTRPRGPIRVLTHLRYFGYCFNPVSFFYLFDQAGKEITWFLPEVHNTPWGDRHLYLLPTSDARDVEKGKRFLFDKTFHVSPFIPNKDVSYRLIFQRPAENLSVHMDNLKDGDTIFDATLNLRRQEIEEYGLNTVLWKHPFMTIKVIASIYWEAWRIWWKGGKYHSHPPAGKITGENSAD